MSTKFCLPIAEPQTAAVMAAIEAHRSSYDLFEIWLDYLEDLTPEFVPQLASSLGSQAIFLFRRQQLEPIKLSRAQREEILRALDKKNTFVDLDILTQADDLASLKQLQIPLIASYHNYQHTPERAELQQIVDRLAATKPAILKVATFCHSRQDAIQLLELMVDLKERHLAFIVLGMGEHGLITRLFGPLWGNEMSFAPVEKSKSTAPGQLTRKELQEILSTLGY